MQPDPGDGVFPANGDPWGTWGGWFDYDPDSVVDESDRWEVELGLVQSSSFANDVPPTPTAFASVTIRRAQAFLPAPGERLTWYLRRASSGRLILAGEVDVDAGGRTTIEALPFGPFVERLEVVRVVRPGNQRRVQGPPSSG